MPELHGCPWVNYHWITVLTEAVCVVVEKTEDGHEIHMQVCDSLSV